MKKKITILITLLAIALCLFFIQNTYAKYITSTNEEANMSIARWRILVNNRDIREGTPSNATITPTFINNDNIADGIIAPTSEGYFDLIIDASEADVSFNYKIEISVNENSSVSDLIATKYSINNGSPISLTRDNQKIENNVIYPNNQNLINIRVYIMWDDSENASMNNKADTQATQTQAGSAKMDIKLTFKQINS